MVASVNFSSTARVDFQTGVPTFLVPVSHWVLRRSTADGLGTFWGIRKGRPKRPHLCRWTLRRVNVLGCWTLIWFLYMQFVLWLVCVGPGRGAGGRGGGGGEGNRLKLLIDLDYRQFSVRNVKRRPGWGIALTIMADMGRLCPKGVPFCVEYLSSPNVH